MRLGPSLARRRRTTAVVAAVVSLLAALGAVALGAPARGADTVLGGLRLTPASGTSIDPVRLTTTSSSGHGCPDGTVSVLGRMTGPGGWAGGVIIVSNTTAGVSTTADFAADVLDTFDGIARSEGIAIETGRYELSLTCQDELGMVTYGRFTATLWFTSTTSWQSTDPAAGPTAQGTTTALAVTPTSGVTTGRPVTLTATVTPPAATGTVRFSDGAIVLGTATVASGRATMATSTLATGAHSLAATFTPSDPGVWSISTSPAVPLDVSPPSGATVTTTTLSISPPSGATPTTDVTLSVAVTPAVAGTVRLDDTIAGTTSTLGTVPLVAGSATSLAEISTLLTAGTHALQAVLVPATPATVASSASPVTTYVVGSSEAGVPLLGSLTFTPPAGADVDPITARTRSTGTQPGCPAGTESVVGYAVGPGPWAAGVLVLSRTSAGISTGSDFKVDLADNFAGIATSNSLPLLAGEYSIRVYCQDELGMQSFGGFQSSLWFVDPTRFQSTDPGTGHVATQLAVSASPADRSDLGRPVTLTARVEPATAVGTVQFRTTASGSFVPLGSPVRVSNGVAVLRLTDRPFGLYELSGVFTATDARRFDTSTSADLLHVVALPLPPIPPRAATLTGTVRVGSTLRCAGAFTGATSVAHQWLRGRDVIAGATRATYRLVEADAGQSVRCRVLATNIGGTTQRTSAAEAVPR